MKVQKALNLFNTRMDPMTTNLKSLIAAAAALGFISTVAMTAAEAKDGCGRGMYYNGQRCTPKGEARFGRNDRWEPGYRKHDRRDRGGMSVDLGPNMRLNFGQGFRLF
jgi:hypothetical protein